MLTKALRRLAKVFVRFHGDRSRCWQVPPLIASSLPRPDVAKSSESSCRRVTPCGVACGCAPVAVERSHGDARRRAWLQATLGACWLRGGPYVVRDDHG